MARKLKKGKDGRYKTSVYIGIVDGKKKSVSVYGRTQKECYEKAAELRQKVKKGIDITADKNTWADWVSAWKNSNKLVLSERQLRDYGYYLRHFEILNSVPLKNLQIADFQNIINDLAVEAPKTKKPTAKKSLIQYRSIASRIFDFAIENRATDFNPVKFVKIPRDAPQKKRRALTEEEQQWIEKLEHRAQLPAMIMLYSGLRLGECLALQWKDINLEEKTIDVHKTLVMSSPPTIKQGTKTDAGIRIVDIPQKLVDFLSPLRQSPFDYVCVNSQNRLYNKTSWRNVWNSYITELNFNFGDFSDYIRKPKSKYQPEKIPLVIERFTAHYLRHTHTTNLFDAGCDILYVKEQMGHSDIETTLGIYTHLSKKNKDTNSKKLDKMLSGNAEKAAS